MDNQINVLVKSEAGVKFINRPTVKTASPYVDDNASPMPSGFSVMSCPFTGGYCTQSCLAMKKSGRTLKCLGFKPKLVLGELSSLA